MNKSTSYHVLWFVVILSSILLFSANLLLGPLNQDEGWYLYGARMLGEGKLPYRDFAFTQGPVMLFVYWLGNPLVAKLGLAGGRLFSILIGVCGIFCSSLLAASLVSGKAAKRVAALLAFMLIGVNAYQSYFTSVVKTYSLGAFFLVVGFYLLTGAIRRKSALAACVSGAAMALAGGTRLSAVVVLPVVFLYLLISGLKQNNEQRRENLLTAFGFFAGGMLMSCLIFLPFLVRYTDSFLFSTVYYHAGREAGGLFSALVTKVGSAAHLVRGYFVAFCLLVIMLAYVLAGRKRNTLPSEESGDNALNPAVPLWISVVVVALVHFAAPFPYDEYQVMVYPLFAAGLGAWIAEVLARLGQFIPSADASGSRPDPDSPVSTGVVWLLFVICMASVFSSPVIEKWLVRGIDRLWLEKREKPALVKLREAGELLESLGIGPGIELLTQDPYLAVETGAVLPKGLEMGQFSYYPEMSDEDAENRNVLNAKMLKALLSGSQAPVAAFSGYGLAVKSPEVVELSQDEQAELYGLLEKRYEKINEISNFGQADTVLKVYTLRDD